MAQDAGGEGASRHGWRGVHGFASGVRLKRFGATMAPNRLDSAEGEAKHRGARQLAAEASPTARGADSSAACVRSGGSGTTRADPGTRLPVTRREATSSKATGTDGGGDTFARDQGCVRLVSGNGKRAAGTRGQPRSPDRGEDPQHGCRRGESFEGHEHCEEGARGSAMSRPWGPGRPEGVRSVPIDRAVGREADRDRAGEQPKARWRHGHRPPEPANGDFGPRRQGTGARSRGRSTRNAANPHVGQRDATSPQRRDRRKPAGR